jgi:hypothetical protein
MNWSNFLTFAFSYSIHSYPTGTQDCDESYLMFQHIPWLCSITFQNLNSMCDTSESWHSVIETTVDFFALWWVKTVESVGYNIAQLTEVLIKWWIRLNDSNWQHFFTTILFKWRKKRHQMIHLPSIYSVVQCLFSKISNQQLRSNENHKEKHLRYRKLSTFVWIFWSLPIESDFWNSMTVSSLVIVFRSLSFHNSEAASEQKLCERAV